LPFQATAATAARSLLAAQARQDFAQVKDIAGQATRRFGAMAQSFIKDLQGGY
jgi:hypothetical protein